MATIRQRSIVLIPVDALDINGEPHIAAGLRYIVEHVFPAYDYAGFNATGILAATDEEVRAAAAANTTRRIAAGLAFFADLFPEDILQNAMEIGIDSAAVTVLRF